MSRVDDYREALRSMPDWDAYLLRESGLPGPRGNLELAHAAAVEGSEAQFLHWLGFDAARAPANSPEEFLAFCGILGLGRLVGEGHLQYLPALRESASDARWRSREAVAQALQIWGQSDMPALLSEMETWARGSLLEQRAAAAALCEPALLSERENTRRVLRVLDEITTSVRSVGGRRSDDFRALRKGMGYCWSVAVAAFPEAGKPAMEKWFPEEDADIRWIMKENLRKKRLERMDPHWVDRWKAMMDRS